MSSSGLASAELQYDRDIIQSTSRVSRHAYRYSEWRRRGQAGRLASVATPVAAQELIQ